MSSLEFSNTKNIRDIGGYSISGIGQVPFWKFIRSDLPYNLTKNEVQLLREMKISTVIDLRSQEEIDKASCVLKEEDGFTYIHCNLYGGGGMPKTEDEVSKIYFAMVQEYQSVYNIIKIISQSEEGVLYHCSAGKDRTGVITALLLLLAGVSHKDICKDYSLSYDLIKEEITALHKKCPDLPHFIGQSKPQYIEKFLELFYEKYKDIEEYLLQIGFNKSEIKVLRNRLIERSKS